MRWVDAFRDPDHARAVAARVRARVTRPWTLMEVCGGQTHALVRYGLERLLPEEITLLHGPGCPVCVTPTEVIDHAVAVARRPEVVLCTFGDMLRVPGTASDLRRARAEGGDVRVVYSPLDALGLARASPDREVVLLAVGFETTAPAVALTVHQAHAEGLSNLSVLVAHVLVPPALEAIGGRRDRRVHAFLAAGHVAAIEGVRTYGPLAARLGTPIVVTGFEPTDLLLGVEAAVVQLEQGRHEVENVYARAVRDDGNPTARALVAQVFEVVPRRWRGLGELPASGLALRAAYRVHDAALRFPWEGPPAVDDPRCRAGEVLQGLLRPADCPSFGGACTPDHPLGATMVSSEGACAAWWRFGRSA